MSQAWWRGSAAMLMALPSRFAVNFDHRLARGTFVMEIRSGLGSPLVLVLLIAATLNLTKSPRPHFEARRTANTAPTIATTTEMAYGA